MKISKETNEEATTSAKTPSDSSTEKATIGKFPGAVVGDSSTGIETEDEEDARGGETFSLTPAERSRKKFFDENASFAEDFIWSQLIPPECKIKYVPSASVCHSHPLSFKFWAKRYFDSGLSRRNV